MDRDTVFNTVTECFQDIRPGVSPGGENLFNTHINCNPVDIAYMLLRIREELGITINQRFMEDIRETTLGSITDAVMNALAMS